jgi:hypothetical protein
LNAATSLCALCIAAVASATACWAERSASTGFERAAVSACVSWRSASATRVRAVAPTAPRRVAMKSFAAATAACASVVTRASCAFARSAWAAASRS